MTIFANQINLYLLVFMRMSGMILFNPIFGRKNVPVLLRGALSLALAVPVSMTLSVTGIAVANVVQLFGMCASELLVGFGIGVILSALFSVVLLAGEAIDLQMGFSMANLYDPASQVSMPVVGSFLNALLIMTFLASNAHLALVKLFSDSFRAFPPGTASFSSKTFQFIAVMGGDVFSMGLRLALPLIAVEFVLQIVMGILMRASPQINIFSVGIQLQTLIGLALLMLLVPVMVTLFGRLSDYILEKCVEWMRLIGTS